MKLSLCSIEKSEPEIVNLDEPIHFIGLSIKTSDRSIRKDILKSGRRFNELKRRNAIPYAERPRVFIAVTKDYDPKTGEMEYCMGDVVTQISEKIPDGLYHYQVPAGTYAVFTVRPKARFLWGYTMGRMKRYIYDEWLPRSTYENARTIDDFEYHDERSVSRHPEIDLYVAITSSC